MEIIVFGKDAEALSPDSKLYIKEIGWREGRKYAKIRMEGN